MKVVGWHTSRVDSAGKFLGRCISMSNPESKDPLETVTPLVTLAEAEAAVKQARIDALEEARAICIRQAGLSVPSYDTAIQCADAIESLKGTP